MVFYYGFSTWNLCECMYEYCYICVYYKYKKTVGGLNNVTQGVINYNTTLL